MLQGGVPKRRRLALSAAATLAVVAVAVLSVLLATDAFSSLPKRWGGLAGRWGGTPSFAPMGSLYDPSTPATGSVGRLDGVRRDVEEGEVGTGVGLSRRQWLGRSVATALATWWAGAQRTDALFEDFLKEGPCPTYEKVRSETVADFDVEKYTGVWYELAYHDWTQYEICGCTRFNMTRMGNRIEDIFTTKCPKNAITMQGETYAVNMSMTINPATPGRMMEKAFTTNWPNMVLDVWKGADGKYSRSIQMQCVEAQGRRAFVGINFLSRKPLAAPGELQEMWSHALALGIAPYGGNPAEMFVVDQQRCRYPLTTDDEIIMRNEKVSLRKLGVSMLDSSLLQ